MKHHFKKSFALVLLMLFSLFSFADDLNLTASASRTTIGNGEEVQITFTINAAAQNFKAPAFSNFNVLVGPSQSTSMQFVNGSFSQTISYTYVLQAKTEGSFKVGPATIDAGGKHLQSNVLTINVVKGNPPPASTGKQQQGGNNNDNSAQDAGSNVYLKVTLNKSSVYQGEAVSVVYKLYTKLNLSSYNINKLPAINGFWSKDIEMQGQPQMHKENVNGVQYGVFEIKKSILFPQRSGTLEIDPMEGEVVAQVQAKRKRSNDPFDVFFNDPFFGGGIQNVKYKVKSTSVKINVKPLPSNSPAGFSGGVGKLSMEAFIDKPETKTDEAVNLKIKITGSGNLQLIEAPKLQFPPDIETYDPKTTDNINVSPTGVSGSRTFEYLLIPRHAGEFKIDPIAFSYFDLDKKEYIKLNSSQFILKVAKGAGNESAATASIQGVNKEDVRLLGKDIRFIKTGNIVLSRSGNDFFGSFLYYLLLSLPLILFVIFFFFRKKYIEMSSNVMLMKQRRATKIALKRLVVAQQHLKSNNKEKFYDEITRALWGYINDKLGISVADLSKESANEALRKKNVNEQLIGSFNDTVGYCEFARFAPANDSLEMEQTYKSAIDIITNFESQLK